MFEIIATNRFKRDMVTCERRGYDMSLLHSVIKQLSETGTLPSQYKPHKLSGNYSGRWECHIKSDWLLVWEKHDMQLVLVMVATGTHSDLF